MAGSEAQLLKRELDSYRSKITRAAHVIFEAWRSGDHDDPLFAVYLPVWAAQHPRFQITYEIAI
jgi:hypothetical protein